MWLLSKCLLSLLVLVKLPPHAAGYDDSGEQAVYFVKVLAADANRIMTTGAQGSDDHRGHEAGGCCQGAAPGCG